MDIDYDPYGSYTSTLTYLTLVLASWLFMDQASSLVLPWKALSAMEAVVEVLFNLYKTSRLPSLRPLKLELDDVVIKYNYSIRGKYPEKRTCSPT